MLAHTNYWLQLGVESSTVLQVEIQASNTPDIWRGVTIERLSYHTYQIILLACSIEWSLTASWHLRKIKRSAQCITKFSIHICGSAAWHPWSQKAELCPVRRMGNCNAFVVSLIAISQSLNLLAPSDRGFSLSRDCGDIATRWRVEMGVWGGLWRTYHKERLYCSKRI